MIARRSFLTGLGSLIAAPAVVKISSIMPIKRPRLLSLHEITREAIMLFNKNNMFFSDEFGKLDFKIGSIVRIRLPNDYYRLAA
jgi:hypothetical protein